MNSYDDSDAIRTVDTNSVLTNTFFRMFLGLLASAVTAFYAYYSGMYYNIIANGYYLKNYLQLLLQFCTLHMHF